MEVIDRLIHQSRIGASGRGCSGARTSFIHACRYGTVPSLNLVLSRM